MGHEHGIMIRKNLEFKNICALDFKNTDHQPKPESSLLIQYEKGGKTF